MHLEPSVVIATGISTLGHKFFPSVTHISCSKTQLIRVPFNIYIWITEDSKISVYYDNIDTQLESQLIILELHVY